MLTPRLSVCLPQSPESNSGNPSKEGLIPEVAAGGRHEASAGPSNPGGAPRHPGSGPREPCEAETPVRRALLHSVPPPWAAVSVLVACRLSAAAPLQPPQSASPASRLRRSQTPSERRPPPRPPRPGPGSQDRSRPCLRSVVPYLPKETAPRPQGPPASSVKPPSVLPGT